MNLFQMSIEFDCELPFGCEIETSNLLANLYGNEISTEKDYFEIMGCPMDVLTEFNFNTSSSRLDPKVSRPCFINNKTSEIREIIEFFCSTYRRKILNGGFKMNNLLQYLSYFYWAVNLNFVKFNGFELNLISDAEIYTDKVMNILFIGSKLDFYMNQKSVRTCEDIKTNLTLIRSILQISSREIYFDNCELKKPLCPLVFMNSYVETLFLIGMIDTFYKRNVLSFLDSGERFDYLNSTIRMVQLAQVENIKLDLVLFNRFVFANLELIFISGFVDIVSLDLFDELKLLKMINFESTYFRKLMHTNGIDWIKRINRDLNVSLNINSSQLNVDFSNRSKLILASCSAQVQNNEPVNRLFPDEDFCLYKDFPFSQLIILMQYCTSEILDLIENDVEFSCTYLWLNQYLPVLEPLFQSDLETLENFQLIINSTSFKSIEKCTFNRKLSSCNKSNYKRREIWMKSDYFLLNKKLQSGVKISTYIISLLGIVTNLLVTIIVLKKRNSELFKGYKHYIYLCLNSLFGLLISVFGVLSWMSDCFYPFEVFCPDIRKIYFFQYFKIVINGCLENSFRFMLSFCYVAFALNRIALLGKDHGKLVEFMSKVGVKKYIFVSFLLSSFLSAIKYFKFNINTGNQDLNYPISNEKDIFNDLGKSTHVLKDVYFILNSISDLVNYVVLVIICFSIDIFMVKRLRKVLDEKMEKLSALNLSAKMTECQMNENEEVVNKAVQMVVINTAVGILFKTPICFIPVVNTYAQFYYKIGRISQFKSPKFGEFYTWLFDTGFYELISDLSDLLFSISIAVQFFVYIRFDKKFKQGLDNLFNEKNVNSDKLKVYSTTIIKNR